ncbi:hypothetical protein [Echinicola sp. 20G]|uniref:hypothetical protein n=1 Tax=Echinicola sp. 20G TaxID=2781961 RepID=UPI0019107328|nr:hypothetical protein [Echinicola sp. 20G]
MKNLYAAKLPNKVWSLALAALCVACSQFDNKDIDVQEGLNVFSVVTNAEVKSNPECAGPYGVVLESVTGIGEGNYEWIWSVENPNPGNGSGGTVQNLSHWNITLGTCATFEDVVSASTSTDGENFTPFDPSYQPDGSLNTCGDPSNGASVFKFDVGTSGSSKTYYKLVVNRQFEVDLNGTAYYKSGAITGCGEFCFPGLGCEVDEETCYQDETAWACGPRYTKKGNWAMYIEVPEYDENVPVGQDIKWVYLQAGNKGQYIGAVKLKELRNADIPVGASPGEFVELLIRIDAPLWSFALDDENVKVQGYDTAPSGNPAPGRFSTLKDMSTAMTGDDWKYYSAIVPRYPFYGVHVDVQKEIPCED